jgi:hypothetical protein
MWSSFCRFVLDNDHPDTLDMLFFFLYQRNPEFLGQWAEAWDENSAGALDSGFRDR